jgi:hypothetical protein
VQQQPKLVDQDVAFLALDQFAGVEAMRIDRRPPFSALFTLWLSMMQAVGLASRAACSRPHRARDGCSPAFRSSPTGRNSR